MSNVVFILGAGASKQAGAPLMANFLDVASDLLWSNLVNDKREHFERVFNAIGGLQAVHSKAQLDLNNIESIFTALELGRIIQRVPGIEDPNDIPLAIASLKELIVKTLEVTIAFPRYKDDIKPPRPYEAFATLVKYLVTEAYPKKTVSVLTFNYDIAVDCAFFLEDLGPNYIIESAPRGRHAVDLLKLHGSLNWAIEKESKKIRPLHLHNSLKKWPLPIGFRENKFEVNYSIASHLVEYFAQHATPAIEVEPEPVIVPPSWNKADYHQALSPVWASAANHLSEAESIFIIGYSLPETDSFFRHLFALGSAGKSALRRIIVFNPDSSGETDKRFQTLLGPGSKARYEYRPNTFEQSLPQIQKMFPKRN
ncbi:MAG: hypothetical protein WCI11_10450 [Candidatus Methylumidiphilus sp.]